MKEENIRKLLPLLGSRFEKIRSGSWVVASCPFAPWRHGGGIDQHPSFAISIGKGISSYTCWSCGVHGRLEDIVPIISQRYDRESRPQGMDLKTAHGLILNEEGFLDMDEIPDWEQRLKPREDIGFPAWWLDAFRSYLKSEEAVKYLRGRQLDFRNIDELDFRYDFRRGRVCVPVRNWQGLLVGLHGRAVYGPADCDGEYLPYLMYVWYRKKDEKVSNPQCWLGEHLVDTEKTVVLAEGMFDFLSVMRVYRNVLSPLMAGMNDNKLKRIGRFSSIVTMFDGDKAGDLARERVDQVLGGPGRRIKHLKLKAGQDGGNMAIEEVIIALDGVVDLDYHPTRLT